MSKEKTNRRDFLKAAGTGAVALGSLGWMRAAVQAESPAHEIRMVRNYPIGRFYFDPIGLHVQPGETVRWICRANGLSAVAFHPDNDNHELRIPDGARAFDSGVLWRGDTFDWTFEVEGTYDYYSKNQEVLGMIGRIVVGSPGGPGEQPWGYGGRAGRRPIFKQVIDTTPYISSREIVQAHSVPYPTEELGRRPPLY